MRRALRQARLERGLSMAEMAEMVGCSYSQYAKIEEGYRNPSLSLARKISMVLGVPMEELFFAKVVDRGTNTGRMSQDGISQSVQ